MLLSTARSLKCFINLVPTVGNNEVDLSKLHVHKWKLEARATLEAEEKE